jgi:hypothetical protein
MRGDRGDRGISRNDAGREGERKRGERVVGIKLGFNEEREDGTGDFLW